MRRRAMLTILAAGTLLVPAHAGAATKTATGVVVKRTAATKTVVLATPAQGLQSVRLASLANRGLGTRLTVSGAAAGATIVARTVKASGKARRVRIRGVVVATGDGYYVLAAHGAVLKIMSTRTVAVGDVVKATVVVAANGTLDEVERSSSTDDGHAKKAHLSGTVASIDTAALTMGVNLVEDGSLVQIALRNAEQVEGVAVGDVVELKVKVAVAADGTTTYTLIRVHHEDGPGKDRAEVELHDATIATIAAGVLTVTTAGQSIAFAIPTGFELGDAAVGDSVDVKGKVVDGVLTLVRIGDHKAGCDDHDDDDGDDDGGGHGGGGHGGGGHGGDGGDGGDDDGGHGGND